MRVKMALSQPRRLSMLSMCGLLAALMSACHAPQRPTLTLSVAASVQDAITEVEAAYQRDHGPVDFRNNFGSSGTLAREIEDGAPVDAFIAAGSKPMDQLDTESLLQPGSRVNLLRNSLVLIAPRSSNLRGFDQLGGSQVKVVALGDAASVPAGMYGKQTLEALHLYDKVSSKVVLGKDVRQVLTYVETGNADAGLVYATDAMISNKVRTVAVAPEESHDPIIYPVAEVKAAKNDAAVRAFLAFLTSPEARAIFVKHGFTMA
jgi:molybdate transport system substrate-binding protein